MSEDDGLGNGQGGGEGASAQHRPADGVPARRQPVGDTPARGRDGEGAAAAQATGLRPPVVERVVRTSDVDPKVDRRDERIVAGLFLLSGIATAGFLAAYLGTKLHTINNVLLSNMTLGGSMTVAFVALGAGIIVWARRLMPADGTVQERHPMRSSDADREDALAVVNTGIEETGLPRRSLIKRSLGLSVGLLAIPPIFLLRDLGPLPHKSLRTTAWEKGSPLLEAHTKRPVKLGDLAVGSIVTVLPPKAKTQEQISKSMVILIRLPPGVNHPAKGREDWAYQGHVAYSKLCTHLGCAVGLYEQTTKHLLCPCHQSTFDVPEACKVVFGPAARSLPQLPITVNENGEFIARDGFDQPVGPSFWERG